MTDLGNQLGKARAEHALSQAGVTTTGAMLRAPGTTNQVFLADAHVVKIGQRSSVRLLREARLCLALPDRWWRPEVVAHGEVDDWDFLVLRRRPGLPLGSTWPDLNGNQRRLAVTAIGWFLSDLHATATPPSLPIRSAPPHLFSAQRRPAVVLQEAINTLRRFPHVDSELVDMLHQLADPNGILEDAGLSDYPADTLVHGDLHLDNVLWDGNQVSGIIDFEWARGGPRELDLDLLFRFGTGPGRDGPSLADRSSTADDFFSIPTWLASVYPELLDHIQLNGRLLLHAMAFEIGRVIADPPTVSRADLAPFHPYNRLINLVVTCADLA